MRALRFMNVAVLSTLVATSIALYGQDDKQQDSKPPRQEDARPDANRDQMKPAQQDEAKPVQQDKQEKKEQKEEKQSNQQMKQNQEMPAHQGAQARPAGKGGHIPDDKFHSNFGRTHTFVVQRTTISGGQSGFVYGGYSFVFVDPWPAGWAYTDDCYVDYIDGEYFLFDLAHPGVRIALLVIL